MKQSMYTRIFEMRNHPVVSKLKLIKIDYNRWSCIKIMRRIRYVLQSKIVYEIMMI